MSRRSGLRWAQAGGFLALAIACNAVVAQYPESDSICVTQGGAACTDIGNGICFLQGGGSCQHCAGGATLPNTYCTAVAGGAGCQGGQGGFYCGLGESGTCVNGQCVNRVANEPCGNVVTGCTG